MTVGPVTVETGAEEVVTVAVRVSGGRVMVACRDLVKVVVIVVRLVEVV